MKRWKLLVLALALTTGGTFGFFTAEVQASPGRPCGEICCADGTCFQCWTEPKRGCICPLIGCV